VQWFNTAYTLPFALLLITGGRLGDMAGRRRTFRLGVTVFALASTACALAPSTGSLIGCRVVQGAAAAATIPQTIGLIKAMFGGPDTAKALGSIGPVMGLAAISGPLIGGVLTHASSWRAAFLVNVPLSVLVLAVTPLLAEDRAPHRPRLDPAGTGLILAGTALAVYPLIRLGGSGLGPLGWVSIGGGLGLMLLFGLHQRARDRRGDQPLIELSLFQSRVFPAALATSTLFFAVTTGLTLVVVVHAQLQQGKGVLAASLTLLPWTIGTAVASYVSGAFLVGRFGNRLMAAGLGLAILGVLGASVRGNPVTFAVTGVGIGLFTTAFFTAALHMVGPREVGSAAGLLNAVQQLGATLGVAVLGSVYLRTGEASSAFLAAALGLTDGVHRRTPDGSARYAAQHHQAERGGVRIDTRPPGALTSRGCATPRGGGARRRASSPCRGPGRTRCRRGGGRTARAPRRRSGRRSSPCCRACCRRRRGTVGCPVLTGRWLHGATRHSASSGTALILSPNGRVCGPV
jgi:MFS family permease